MADEPMTTTTAEGSPFIKITLPDGSIEMRHPEYDRLKEAGKNAPAVDPVPMSEEEVAAGQMASLRRTRDQKLAETDWSQTEDVPDALKQKYKVYRQALRDITKKYNHWAEVVWPDKP